MQTNRESSVLFSLKELRDIERQRIEDEARAEADRRAEAAAKAEAARAAEEEARAAEEERRRREELEIRIAAEARARVEAERAAAVQVVRSVEPPPARPPMDAAPILLRPRRAMAPWLVAGAMAIGSVAWAISRPPRVIPAPPPEIVVRTVYLDPPAPQRAASAAVTEEATPAVQPRTSREPRGKAVIIRPPKPEKREKDPCAGSRDPLCGLD